MKPKILDDYYQRSISSVLGREISPSEAENVNSFLDFSPSEIKDLQTLGKISGLLVIAYIRFRIKGHVALRTAKSYAYYVIQEGMPVEEWRASEDEHEALVASNRAGRASADG